MPNHNRPKMAFSPKTKPIGAWHFVWSILAKCQVESGEDEPQRTPGSGIRYFLTKTRIQISTTRSLLLLQCLTNQSSVLVNPA